MNAPYTSAATIVGARRMARTARAIPSSPAAPA